MSQLFISAILVLFSCSSLLALPQVSAKGKVIYVDNWATWCGPCIQKFPDSKRLKEAYEGQDLVFLYFCMDAKSKAKEWAKIVQKMKLEGEHFLFPKAQNTYFKELFKLEYFPTYALIDKEGNLVHAGDDLSPTDKKTKRMLDELLK